MVKDGLRNQLRLISKTQLLLKGSFVVSRQSDGSHCYFSYTFIIILCYYSTLSLSFPPHYWPSQKSLLLRSCHTRSLSLSSPSVHFSEDHLSSVKQDRFLTQSIGNETHQIASPLPSVLMEV